MDRRNDAATITRNEQRTSAEPPLSSIDEGRIPALFGSDSKETDSFWVTWIVAEVQRRAVFLLKQ